MKTYKDIFSLNERYLDYILSKSHFLNQYTKNISETGNTVEIEIRAVLSKLIPKRFKITHGYIANANSRFNEPSLSPQIDLIIVDTLVPHSLFTIDDNGGLEIVPREAVVGIFEIKRTLDKTSLQGTMKSIGAFDHLKNICDSVNIIKNNNQRFLPGGVSMGNGLSGGYYCNPIIGIIGLSHSSSLTNNKSTNYIDKIIGRIPPGTQFDLITSFDGIMYAPIEMSDNNNWKLLNLRPTCVNYGLIYKNKSLGKTEILAKAFGYILAYLSQAVGKIANIENYFFNNSLK